MSEHPPIPEWAIVLAKAAVEAGRLGGKDDRVIAEGVFKIAANRLWREWTRGMAVVPLPEPDGFLGSGGGRWDLPDHTVTGRVLNGSPLVCEDGGPDFSPTYARMRAAALLAAADRAEQLAAEANAEAVNQP